MTGHVLRRTDVELILRTAHGVLVIPARDVQSDVAPVASPVAVSRARLQALHREASGRHQAKDYRRAIVLYEEVLFLAPLRR